MIPHYRKNKFVFVVTNSVRLHFAMEFIRLLHGTVIWLLIPRMPQNELYCFIPENGTNQKLIWGTDLHPHFPPAGYPINGLEFCGGNTAGPDPGYCPLCDHSTAIEFWNWNSMIVSTNPYIFNNNLLYVSSSSGRGDGGGNGDDDKICNRSRSQGRGRGRSSSRSSNSSNSSSSSSRSCKIMIRQYRTALYNTVKYSWCARMMS